MGRARSEAGHHISAEAREEVMSGTGAEVAMSNGRVFRGWVDDMDDDDYDGELWGKGAVVYPDGRIYLGSVSEGELPRTGTFAVLLPDKKVHVGFIGSRQSCEAEISPDGGFLLGTSIRDDPTEYLGPPQTIGGGWGFPPKEQMSDTPLNDGVMFFPDGRLYVGKFENGKAGSHYKAKKGLGGEFEDHHVQGVMLFPDGRVFVGEFTDGKPDGYGSMITPGGWVRTGDYSDGEPEAA